MSTESIIQGILSPKIVSDGNGGYTAKTDIVNVDKINATSITTTDNITTYSNITTADVYSNDLHALASISLGPFGNKFIIQSDGGNGAVFNGSASFSFPIYGNNFSAPVTLGTDLRLETGTITAPGTITINKPTIFTDGISVNGTSGITGSFSSLQCGTGNFSNETSVTITPASAPLLTSDSIILVTPRDAPSGRLYVSSITPATSFVVSSTTSETLNFNWFIAKF